MKFTPHEYQKEAINHILNNPGSALWLDMGLGKTSSTLIALKKIADRHPDRKTKTLIVAPLRVAHHTWPEEIEKWDDFKNLTYTVIKGPVAKRKELIRSNADIHIINYEQLQWLVFELKNRWFYDTVVYDEFSKMKSHRTKRFKAMRKVKDKVKRTIGLTGTPAANGLMDLWAQTFLLDQGKRLGGSFIRFRDRYFNSDYMGFNWELKPNADKEIHKKLDDICLSMSAEDYLSLPERIDNTVYVEMPPKLMKKYKDLEREFITELNEEKIVTVNTAAAKANKCLQYANGFVYTEEGEAVDVHDLKIETLKDIIEEAAGAPVLVAYNYVEDANRIMETLPAQTLGKDSSVIEKWNRGEIPILLAHPASASHGLNLQAGGNIIVWYGLNWSLEYYLQFNGRLHRQGQGKPVFIHHIVTKGTIDERVMRVLMGKNEVQSGLLNAMKKEYEIS